MIFEKAMPKDINMLTELRIAYLQEDLGEMTEANLELIKSSLPFYYEKHINKDLLVYVARNKEDIVSCAFLLIVEKPMSPSFITGKTGTVLNVYTKPEYRNKGYAKKLMSMMLEDAAARGLSVIELKSTEDGYSLYKAVGFEDVGAKYHNMKIVLQRLVRRHHMEEKITLCGDNCIECPRYNANSEEELRNVAELWYRVGWRDCVVSNEEIRCEGCSSHKQCTYHLVECTKEHNVDKCNQCVEFPCEKIDHMLERSKEYQKRCKVVCSDAEYDMLEKAFFDKEKNLRK